MIKVQNPYLFEDVLSSLIKKFIPVIEEEGSNNPAILSEQGMAERFETFPRSVPLYSQMITTLAGVAAYDVVSVLHDLRQQLSLVLAGRNLRGVQASPKSGLWAKFMLAFQLTLITDTVCEIVCGMKEMAEETAKALISGGIAICMKPPQSQDFAAFLLNQWSVTLSVVSKLAPDFLYDCLTQLIINKSDLFFVLVRYVRLDYMKSHSEDMVDLMMVHVRKAKQRRMLESSMLASLSTLLMSYNGNNSGLVDLYKIALALCEKPNPDPGAVELMVTLLPKMEEGTKEKIQQFYEEKVFPLAKRKDGMITAVRALRNLMYGKDVDLNLLFWNWGPSHRDNRFHFVKRSPSEAAPQNREGSFGSIFMTHFVDSPYFGQCPHLIRDVIVHLAALDFDYFSTTMYNKFSEFEDNDRFMVFLNTVPMINNPLFEEYAQVSHDKIEEFNKNIALMVDTHLTSFPRDLKNYGFPCEIYQEMRKSLEEPSKIIDDLLGQNWKINIGDPYDVQLKLLVRGAASSDVKQPSRIIRILPYVLSSQMFEEHGWARCIIQLASLDNVMISKPAYQICQRLVQDPKRRDLVVREAIEMIQKFMHPAIVSTCLKLLIEAIGEMEPQTPQSYDAFEYDIEFAAFLALTCAHPFVRMVGYDLLAKINKLLQNQGLFAKIESHINAILSNVKHNILLQQFPKRPGHNKYPDEELSLETTRDSRYQAPWLFFLTEFGRIIVHSSYLPILIRIQRLCDDPELANESNDFSLGLLVMFCATCTIKENVAEDLYVYDMPVGQTAEIPEFHKSFSALISRIVRKPECLNNLISAMKHSNYTIVPMMTSAVREQMTRDSMITEKITLQFLPSLYMLLCCIEGNNALRKRVFDDLQEILANKAYTDFISCDWNCKGFVGDDQRKLQELGRRIEESPNAEDLILSYLSCLIHWLDIENGESELQKWNVASRYRLTLFVGNWASLPSTQSMPICNTISMYAAEALVSIFSVGPIFNGGAFPLEKKIISMSAECDRRGFKVLRPFLQNNTQSLSSYINACFNEVSVVADLFFDAICFLVTERNEKVEKSQEKAEKSQDNLRASKQTRVLPDREVKFWNNSAGSLFLLGLTRLKTGSLLAPNFLKVFIPFYAFLIGNTDDQLKQDLATLPIHEIPTKYFPRVAESVVSEALTRIKDSNRKVPTKILVDIVSQWVRLFRMLPKDKTCVPGVAITSRRLSPREFLQQLLEVTESTKDDHDFLRIVEIWTNLLIVPDHRQLVLVYIIEYAEASTRRMLFDELLSKFPKIVIEMLAERCKFAYFAYVSYQKEADFEQEFWFVPVIMRALKYHMEYCIVDLHKFIHFAMLFHANQTQSLLKRLCKYMDIPYSRRTLSSGSLKKIVTVFEKKLIEKHKVSSMIPPRAISPDIVPEGDQDEPKEPEKDPKSRPPPITRWAREAIRWAIGCKNVRFAYLSLVILNTFQDYTITSHDQQDLLRGLCKSSAYFLSICKSNDPQTHDYIRETFTVFKTHFLGNEEFALNYIRAYLSFVVSVDAYYDQMVRLFLECVKSPNTSSEALNDVLAVLQPSFNELESNSTANRTFQDFITSLKETGITDWDIDLQFVKEALKRTGQASQQDRELIRKADSDQRNRALRHYSLMVDTASADLKKRIFVLSCFILEEIWSERRDARERLDSMDHSYRSSWHLQPTSVADVNKTETIMSRRTEEEDKMEVAVADRSDLNKQALVVIFNAAVDMLPHMKEALDFVEYVSKIEPLIVTVPIIDQMDWKEAVPCVVRDLEAYGTQENATVTLTDCKHLGSASNLLNKESQPKILPYNTQHDLLQSIVGEEEGTKFACTFFDGLAKTFTVIGRQFVRKLSDRSSPNIVYVNGQWDRITPPEVLITDDRLASNDEGKDAKPDVDSIVCSDWEFMKMPED